MASNYELTLAGYAPFEKPLTLKVVPDKGLPLSASLAALQPGIDFSVIPDEAVKCAVRHLFIDSKAPPPNPATVTRSWLNLLRWELMTFWRCDSLSNVIDDDTGTMAFSSEHPRRSGELLAEGFAILLLERRLKVNRNRFFFYSGKDARPDFVVSGHIKAATGFISPSKHRFGLECRARTGIQSIHADDYQALANKKGVLLQKTFKSKGYTRLYWPTKFGSTLDIVLAAYLSYGTSQATLILGDPGEPGESLSTGSVLEVVLGHYVRSCARIGLWRHAAVAEAALRQVQGGRVPRRRRDPGRGGDASLNTVPHGKRLFLGRFFSDTVLQVQLGRLERATAEGLVEQGRADYFFLGLDQEVLRMLRTHSWEELLAYFAEPEGTTAETPMADDLQSDGMLVKTRIEDPDDQELILLAIRAAVR